MKKRLFSIVLAICMLFTMFPTSYAAEYEAKIVDSSSNTTYYESFKTACNTAPAGSTVYLLKNVSGYSKKDINIKNSCTIDLGGFTASGQDVIYCSNGATVTVQNGTIYSQTGTSCVGVYDAGTMYVKNVSLTGDNVFYGTGGHTYFMEGVTSNANALYSTNGNAALHIIDGTYVFSRLEYNYGTVNRNVLFISGGCFKYNSASLANYIVNGYKIVDCQHSRSGYYDVVVNEEAIVAEVHHTDASGTETVTKFAKLSEAIQSTASGDTVKLLKDIAEDTAIASNKNITLDLNGKTLSPASASNTVITNKGTLILTDTAATPGKITGGAVGVLQEGALSLAGKVTITGNTKNLYLPSGKTVTVVDGFAGSVGVSTQAKPGAVAITGTNNADYSSCFTSDNQDYFTRNADNIVYLLAPVSAKLPLKVVMTSDSENTPEDIELFFKLQAITESAPLPDASNLEVSVILEKGVVKDKEIEYSATAEANPWTVTFNESGIYKYKITHTNVKEDYTELLTPDEGYIIAICDVDLVARTVTIKTTKVDSVADLSQKNAFKATIASGLASYDEKLQTLTIGDSNQKGQSSSAFNTAAVKSEFAIDFTKSFTLSGYMAIANAADGSLVGFIPKEGAVTLSGGGSLGVYGNSAQANGIFLELDDFYNGSGLCDLQSGSHFALTKTDANGNPSLINNQFTRVSYNQYDLPSGNLPYAITFDADTKVLEFVITANGKDYRYTVTDPVSIFGQNTAYLIIAGSMRYGGGYGNYYVGGPAPMTALHIDEFAYMTTSEEVAYFLDYYGRASIDPTITMSSYTYGGESVPAPAVTKPDGSGKVTYYYNTTDSTEGGTEWKDITGSSLDAGVYYMYAVVEENEYYFGATTPTVEFTVSQKQLTVSGTTVIDKSYDATVKAYISLGNVSGIFAGDDLTVTVSGSYGDANVGSGKNVQVTYAISGDDACNYYAPVDETLRGNIVKRVVNLYSESAWKAYDGTELTKPTVYKNSEKTAVDEIFAAEIEGLTATGTVTNVVDSPVINAITYAFKSGCLESNFTVNKVEGLLAITKATTMTLTAENYTGVYDGLAHGAEAVPSVTADTTVSYSVDGGKTWSTQAPTITDAGTVNVIAKAENPNYKTAECSYTLTVSKAQITITTGSASKAYDGTPLTADGSVSGLKNDEEVTLNVVGSQTNAGRTSNTYIILWNKTAKESNYEIVAENIGTLVVTQRTVNLYSESAMKPYDGTPLTKETVYKNSELQDVDEVFASEVSGLKATGTVTNVIDSPVINEITFEFKDGFSEDNYIINKTEGVLAITRAETLTIDVDNYSGIYDGREHTVEPDISVTEGTTVTYSTDGGEHWSFEAPVILDAGKINVTVKAENPNYKTAEANYTLTVAKAPLTVVTEDASKEYDGLPLTADGTVTGLIGDEEVSFEVNGSQTNAGSSDNTYTIVWDKSAIEDNYEIVTETIGSLEVTKRSVSLYSESATKQYDGTALTAPEVYKNSDLEDVDEVFANEVESLTATGTATNVLDGNVVNTITYTFKEGFSEDNYEISKTEGTIVIAKADAFEIAVEDYNEKYDGIAHGEAAVPAVTEGTTISYSTDGGTSWSSEIPVILNAGTLEVMVKAENPNYETSTASYTLTVTKRSVIITSDSASKVYDEIALTAENVTISGDGFVEGEGAEYSFTGTITNAGTGSNGFTYELNENTSADNYDITVVYGTLKITSDPNGDKVVDDEDVTEVYDKLNEEDPESERYVYLKTDGEVSQDDKDIVVEKVGNKDVIYNSAELFEVVDGVERNIGSENDTIIEVVYKFTYTEADVHVWRVHNGEIDELTETPNELGEYVVFDREAGTLTVAACKYSTFAFAYDEIPATGDSNITVWFAIVAVSILGAGALLRKKKYEA